MRVVLTFSYGFLMEQAKEISPDELGGGKEAEHTRTCSAVMTCPSEIWEIP